MDTRIKVVYRCYLGNELGYRTFMIDEFIKAGGKWFFREYGTDEDSISNFISKAEKLGLY